MIDTTRMSTTGVQDVVVEKTINAAPERIYKALTDPAELERWFFTDCSVSPAPAAVGGAYRHAWRDAAGGDHERFGDFLELVPGRKVVFEWRGDTCKGEKFDLGTTIVSITLTPAGNGTRVRLVHSGWKDTPGMQKQRDGHEGGWTFYVENLTRYLTGGTDERTNNHGQVVKKSW